MIYMIKYTYHVLQEAIFMKKFFITICLLISVCILSACNNKDTSSKIKVNNTDSSTESSEITQEGLITVDKENKIKITALKPDKTTFTSEDKLEIHIKASGFSKDSTAWVGLVPSDIGHGKEAICDSYDVCYEYLTNIQNGTVVFENISGQTGNYDIRVFDDDDNGKEIAYITGLKFQ